jgi:hypothetical protein
MDAFEEYLASATMHKPPVFHNSVKVGARIEGEIRENKYASSFPGHHIDLTKKTYRMDPSPLCRRPPHR